MVESSLWRETDLGSPLIEFVFLRLPFRVVSLLVSLVSRTDLLALFGDESMSSIRSSLWKGDRRPMGRPPDIQPRRRYPLAGLRKLQLLLRAEWLHADREQQVPKPQVFFGRASRVCACLCLGLSVQCSQAQKPREPNGRMFCCGNSSIEMTYGRDYGSRAALFFDHLKAGVQRNDRKAVAELMSYPLPINGLRSRWIVFSSEDFVDKYDRIMTEELKSTILNMSSSCLEPAVGGGFTMVGENPTFALLPNGRFAVIQFNAFDPSMSPLDRLIFLMNNMGLSTPSDRRLRPPASRKADSVGNKVSATR